jgi:hypothetical protein
MGFAFMSTPCGYPLNPAVYDNTCSSAVQACFSFKQSNSECSYVTRNMAYHAARGIVLAMFTKETRVTKLIIAESDISLVIKPGNNNMYDNPVTVSEIYFNALARPECTKCY